MKIFFYGLFMDVQMLEDKGLEPEQVHMAYLDNFKLKIGNRASLVPFKGKRSYGLLVTANENRIKDLYSEASVSDYIPETVLVVIESGQVHEAICYNLPDEKLEGANPAYAEALYILAKKIGLPEVHLKEIL